MFDIPLMIQAVSQVADSAPEVLGWEDELRFLGMKLINIEDFTELLIRFVFNTAIIFVVVHYMYARQSKRKEFYFSYLAICVIVFFLSALLNNVKLELGFALGLFAIFGIIRYRTDAIPIKEMTYLFVVIGISVINALATRKVSYAELIFTNAAILTVLWVLEKSFVLTRERSIKLVFDKLDHIHAGKNDLLLADLKERTGINITRFAVRRIDYERNIAEITVYFKGIDETPDEDGS